MSFRKAGTLVSSGLLLLPAVWAQETKLAWFQNYEEGRAAAARQGQLMIVSLETQWCSWCLVMEQQVFSDPEVVRRFGSSYVWVRLDAEATPEGVAAHRKFRSTSYPFTAVVDPVDELFISIRGYRDLHAFIRDADAATAELQSLARLRSRVTASIASLGERLKLAQEYQEDGLYPRAAAVFEALRHEPSLANADEILFRLAICQASSGENAKALDSLAEFSRQFPNSALRSDAQALRWEIELHSGKRVDARKHLRAWLAENPDHRLSDHVRALLAQQE